MYDWYKQVMTDAQASLSWAWPEGDPNIPSRGPAPLSWWETFQGNLFSNQEDGS